ncbi:MAG: phospholipase A [Steroidobacteraceae bacterium]|jgi:phospholipase A1|nr:phospholipase A [Steroidobacteraceae bacterium]
MRQAVRLRPATEPVPGIAPSLLLVLAGALAAPADAAPAPEALATCARLADAAQRLACFDALVPPPPTEPSGLLADAPVTPLPPDAARPDGGVAAPGAGTAAASAGATRDAQPPLEQEPGLPPRTSPIGNRWAIGVDDAVFDIRPHRPTYILPVSWSSDMNQRPGSPTRPPGPRPLGWEETEAKFQLSFKFKLADLEDEIGASLWAGYTQQSQWQVYAGELSRPFRETNYEPELMLAFHPDVRLLGWDWRLLNVGLVHQSNGRGQGLSRSWNRVYAQVGAERGRLALLARTWVRIEESSGEDDNPDIQDFLGRGELVASYALGRHQLSLLGRYAFDTGNGSAEATWSFPLARRVRGYVQLFSGYGESLVDYNWKQTTIGVGISLADWF